ncbi:MAG: tetratricopeptide repeat protein [Alphaproteobacteria bacterium]|nr:tetratricopeptide repeat protein [Alphaproteobacteria bacterium]
MANHIAWVVVTVALLAVAGCTTPDTSTEWAQCKGGPGVTGDVKLAGCTAVIQAGRATGETLAEAFQNRCWLYKQQEEFDSAIRDCDRAIELNPDYSDAYFSRAKIYFHKHDYDQAIGDFSQTIRLEPKAFGAVTLRGMTYARKGDYDRAIADYTKALQLYPGFGMAEGGLTEARESKARLTGGQKPGDPRAWCDGKALVEEGYAQDLQISGCTKLIQSGRETRSDLAEDYFKRAKAYDFSGSNRDRAIADYGQAIKLKPNHAEAYFSRGTLYYLAAQHDQAIADFDRAIRQRPGKVLYFSYRGQARHAKGQWAAAISDFDHAIKLQPKSAETLVDRARSFIGKGDYRRAIADCDQAIKLSPENGVTASYNTRGDAYFHLRDWRNAISDYDRALELWPEYPVALYGRGAAKTQLGNVAEGRADMQAAQKLQADLATIEAKLGIAPAK